MKQKETLRENSQNPLASAMGCFKSYKLRNFVLAKVAEGGWLFKDYIEERKNQSRELYYIEKKYFLIF